MQFGSDLGLDQRVIDEIAPQITFITANSEIEALALVSSEGYVVAFSALPHYQVDGYRFGGLSSAILMTAKSAMTALFNEDINEIIVRGDEGYFIVSNAGRFVLVGAGTVIQTMMKTVKVFRIAANKIREILSKI
jgi:predicted regulator of Ras-like GTPase activity (Roadblock/LC7/MglB family)